MYSLNYSILCTYRTLNYMPSLEKKKKIFTYIQNYIIEFFNIFRKNKNNNNKNVRFQKTNFLFFNFYSDKSPEKLIKVDNSNDVTIIVSQLLPLSPDTFRILNINPVLPITKKKKKKIQKKEVNERKKKIKIKKNK